MRCRRLRSEVMPTIDLSARQGLSLQQVAVGRPDTSGHPRKSVARKSGTGTRLRIGYVSSDLRDHAVGFALREVLELHDKNRVEVYAYYCGDPVANDPTQNRMKAAIDCWREIGPMTDEAAARQIAADDIDILIDVNGYTKHARTRIFAYRPAPVIVNFCGYPGSMGSPFHQYMITDELVVPEENRSIIPKRSNTFLARNPSTASASSPKSRHARRPACRKRRLSMPVSTACRRSRRRPSASGCRFLPPCRTACSGC